MNAEALNSSIPPPAILAVDDNLGNLEALEVILGDLGCKVVRANGGAEALRLLIKGEPFALILMDVAMPGMNGFEAAELIRQRAQSSTMPIIFITASAEAKTQAFRGYQTGAVDYLLKPLDPEILRAKVRVFLELAQARDKIARYAEELSEMSTKRSEAIVNSAMDAIICVDASHRIVLFNPAAEKLFRCPAKQALGRSLDFLIPERFRAAHRKHMRRFEQSGRTNRRMERGQGGKLYAMRTDGVEFPIEASISKTELGEQKYFTIVLRDITKRLKTEQELKAALEKEVVLKREIHHRVKNSLQVVISMLFLQSQRTSDPASLEILRECQSRTRAIALIYGLLSDSGNFAQIEFAEYARRLTSELLMTYQGSQCVAEVEIEAKGIFLDMDTALPCGLIITELVSNSLKHAFPRREKGSIRIQLIMTEDGRLEMTVKDDGVGPPSELDLDKGRTVGLSLVRDLAGQLGGTLSFEKKNGVSAKIEWPKAAPATSAASQGRPP